METYTIQTYDLVITSISPLANLGAKVAGSWGGFVAVLSKEKARAQKILA